MEEKDENVVEETTQETTNQVQEDKQPDIDLNKFEEFPSTTVSLDTIKVDTTIVEKKKIESKVCGKNTGKNLPCKNKTKHESGSCHHHRD